MLQTGTRLNDRYVLVDMVGRGSLSEVWRADDTTLGRVVAVKLTQPLLSDDPGFMSRFRAYAQAVAMLNDPHIVETYDVGQTGGIYFLVMQFLRDESLHAHLRRVGPLAPHEAMNLIAQAARALHVAHRNGVVHGDVTTSNLLVRTDGHLLVSDFGLARIVSAESMTELRESRTDGVYISPDTLKGHPSTPLTDIYALGAVAYVCLTQVEPFPGESPTQIARTIVHRDPPPLPPHIPEAVRHIVMRALADPPSRWPSAEEMGAAAAALVHRG